MSKLGLFIGGLISLIYGVVGGSAVVSGEMTVIEGVIGGILVGILGGVIVSNLESSDDN